MGYRSKLTPLEWADLAVLVGRRVVPNKLRVRVETILAERELWRVIRESSKTELELLGGPRGAKWLDDLAASKRARRWERAFRTKGQVACGG